MSLEKAKADLEQKGFLDHVIELKESTATVAEAAEALDVKPGMIAKTMSFLQGEKADTLGDDDLCGVRKLMFKCLTDQGISLCIDCGSRVVQDQDFRFL